MKKILLFYILVIMCTNLQAQYSSSASYFPLQIGNKWKYKKYTHNSGGEFTYLTVSVTKDTLVNNIRSYYLHHIPEQSDYWVMYDSASGILHYGTQPGNPFLKLSALTGDTTNFILIDQADTFYYNTSSHIKKYFKNLSAPHNFSGIEINLIKYFGQTYYHEYFSSPSGSTHVTAYLQGCVINGIVYGDTSNPIGITQLSSQVPESYRLKQNYPNPFNPSTNIKFDVPKSSFITLTIYDAIGKEISVLVNENLNAGSYSVDWDASTQPSGVYFYRLTAGGFSETKKMVLIK